MSVIHVRDVPDDVRTALAEAAQAEGLSLSGYVRRELALIARRAEIVAENRRIIIATRAAVNQVVPREEILSVLHEGRNDRFNPDRFN